MIETRLLYYFLAIAREQSVTKAAESLHISQSTLSKQMQDFERQIGKQLFIRGNRQITLTENGAYLRSRAQEIMNLIDKTESGFHAGDSLVEGDLYFGCGETPAMDFITRIFQNLQSNYPGLKFHVYSGNADDVVERLEKGLLDMGLLLGPAQYEKYDYLPLKHTDAFGLLMPGDCPLAEKEVVDQEDLKDVSLILPAQSGTVVPDIHSLNVVATYNLIYNATFMVEHGMGCALCLENLLDLVPGRSLVFRPIDPPLRVEAYIVTKKYQTFSAAAKLFLERLKEELEEM